MSELSELISDIEKQVSDLLHDNTELKARIELLEQTVEVQRDFLNEVQARKRQAE